MKKLKRISPEEMEAQKIQDDMAMTPNERLLYALRLTDLARSLSSDQTFPPKPDDGISWIELKPKDETAGK